jgi:hypothetical protein
MCQYDCGLQQVVLPLVSTEMTLIRKGLLFCFFMKTKNEKAETKSFQKNVADYNELTWILDLKSGRARAHPPPAEFLCHKTYR